MQVELNFESLIQVELKNLVNICWPTVEMDGNELLNK